MLQDGAHADFEDTFVEPERLLADNDQLGL